MERIVVSYMDFGAVYDAPVEIVERKGIGHPDTICDYLAEEVSLTLCEYYLKEFGAIMHHNTDKALLIGGTSEVEFGGGKITSPIEIYLVGRAIKGSEVEELVRERAKEWLSKNIRHLDVERDVKLFIKLREGSSDLIDLFLRFSKGQVPLSNDTSFGVGYAPLDTLESLVFEAEKFLNSERIKRDFPFVGEDVKVMGVRRGEEINLTVACAFVSRYLKSAREYLQAKEEVRKSLEEHLKDYYQNFKLFINTADDERRNSFYLTVSGTSAESGDDGQVGRGNRANGLITPYRPMTLEATAGKNPVSHVGKIYNITASAISRRVVEEVEGVEEAYTYIVSQIGKPINEPQVLEVKVRSKGKIDEKRVKEIAQEELQNMPKTWEKFLKRLIKVA